tara:strand:- start:9158 stop:9418 length:261 start_codon:yes stop_codon:yes gene_type:complete
MRLLFFILLTSSLFSQSFCPVDNQITSRSLYSVGDTLSIEDQNMLFPVCNGSGNYSTGDSFSFSDLNGDINGGDYKITLISMNATW